MLDNSNLLSACIVEGAILTGVAIHRYHRDVPEELYLVFVMGLAIAALRILISLEHERKDDDDIQ